MSPERVIGVTGLPCAGKSFAAQLLSGGVALGRAADLVKADDLGHTVLERPEVLGKICRHFALDPSLRGASARRAIADVVFRDPASLDWLEGVVHPLVFQELEAAARAASAVRPIIMEAALLLTGNIIDVCDVVVIVEANLDIRMVRAAHRGWPPTELAKRERRLLPLFTPGALAPLRDKIIYVRNNADDGRLGERLEAAWTGWRSGE